MSKSMSAADRVRPILQAMDRSVDAARRRRLHGSVPATPDPSRPANGDGASTPPTRLKARPKRSTPIGNLGNNGGYRSQLG